MKIKFKYKINRHPDIESVLAKHKIEDEVVLDLNNLDVLTDIVHVFRPSSVKKRVSIKPLITFLSEHPHYCNQFSSELKRILKPLTIRPLLTEAGILQNRAFLKELKRRLIAKVLPLEPEKNEIEYFLGQLFFYYSDYTWVVRIPRDELVQLFELLQFKSFFTPYHSNNYLRELFQASNLITQRISGRALEEEILAMVPEYDYENGPFQAMERAVSRIEYSFIIHNKGCILKEDEAYLEFLENFKLCKAFLDQAYTNSSIYGISMSVNHNLIRLRQQLDRLKRLMELIVKDDSKNENEQSVDFSLQLLKYHSTRNDIGQLIKENTENIAYEITTHTAKTGEHYITDSGKEYRKMLFASMGGGLIVGFLCIFKLLLSNVETSQFGHAFYYSMNYSIGFIAIYLLGFTLATKQPAMTAAALIRTIEEGRKNSSNGKTDHYAFAELFSRVFRSQFIAFVGNVIIAFPVSLAVVWGWFLLTGNNMAAAKADHLLEDINPFMSPLIFHSAIAGVFLFLSGIISGEIANRNKHYKIPYRIAEHPILKLTIGRESALKLSKWVEKKWAGVYSNFWFGIFMGTTSSIGIFLGLNLDIRHITFASGNFAMGLFGSNWEVPLSMMIWCFLGIGIIGLVNFCVSFALSLFVAFKSRQIPTSELKFLSKAVWKYFKKRPYAFFFPVRPSEYLRNLHQK